MGELVSAKGVKVAALQWRGIMSSKAEELLMYFVKPFLCAAVMALSPVNAVEPAAQATAPQAEVTTELATPEQLQSLQNYIKDSWQKLRRSNHDLLKAATDPKHPPANGKWAVFVADTEPVTEIHQKLAAQLSAAELAQLDIRPLSTRAADEHGILYLPHPYVVPGGRFNEMYAWDSYFIVLGLLHDGETQLALDMVNNALYEVTRYGTFLNANRSYYLTRSQPPALSGMVQAVYERTHDKAWLAASMPALERYYRFWQKTPHKTKTGLSRYYDSGHGPAPEVVSGEINHDGEGAYDRIKAYYRSHAVTDYKLSRFYNAKKDTLTDAFFIGDRSMRESGFDPSARFGAFNVDVAAYNPVCLNTLLYTMEQQMASFYGILDKEAAQKKFTARALLRAERINRYNWDEQAGQYFDYNTGSKKRRQYVFATTFYPLYAGLASPKQAARVVANLALLERPGGLLTSNNVSGNQWDAPYGWAPLHLMAIQGLRRYGYHTEANRISINFLSLVLRNYIDRKAVFEKYDVSARHAATDGKGLQFGYTSNEIGFGWTNATFLLLYDQLPEALRPKVLQLQGIAVGDTTSGMAVPP